PHSAGGSCDGGVDPIRSFPGKNRVPLEVSARLAGYELGVNHESNGIGQSNLPELQGHQAQGRGAYHLHRPAPQATPGLTQASTQVFKETLWPVSLASTFRRISTPKSV